MTNVLLQVVNRIQKLRKTSQLKPTDLVDVYYRSQDNGNNSLEKILQSQVSKVILANRLLLLPLRIISWNLLLWMHLVPHLSRRKRHQQMWWVWINILFCMIFPNFVFHLCLGYVKHFRVKQWMNPNQSVILFVWKSLAICPVNYFSVFSFSF